MTRAFFWVAAIVGALFGLLMFFAPPLAAQAFGVAINPLAESLFRVLGATLLGLALLNFLVRDHSSSPTLKAVLWANAAVHGIGGVADIWSAAIGDLTWSSIAAGMVVHIVILVWALWLLLRPSTA